MSAQDDEAFEPRIGILTGSDTHDRLITGKLARTRNFGNTDLVRLLGTGLDPTAFHVTKNYFRQPVRHKLGRYDCLFNMVTDPDLNPKVLENLARLLRGYRGKVVNRPEAVLRSSRELVARQFAGLPGVHVPKTIRLKTSKPHVVRAQIEKAGLEFPAIARVAGTHEGRILGLFHSLNELQPHLIDAQQKIVTEFVDYRSPDGLYRKYRVFFFGRHIVLRHLIVSDSWNVHAPDRKRFMAPRPDLVDEERQLFADPAGAFPPPVRQSLAAIRDQMELDLFGLDFGLTPEGKLLLFEANATMNFFPFMELSKFPHVVQCLEPAREAFASLLGLSQAVKAHHYPSQTTFLESAR